jgi:hypothetical protein
LSLFGGWPYNQAYSGPSWSLTFAEAAEQMKVGERGRSLEPTDNRDRFAAERLHTKGDNWCCAH